MINQHFYSTFIILYKSTPTQTHTNTHTAVTIIR